jgi:rhodanese-related sulfurtransferase
VTTRLTATQVADLVRRAPDTRLLDVRSGAEFETAHIPGSYNVPLADLDEHGASIASITEHVVLVCQTGGRASRANETLIDLGMSNVAVMEGGIEAWERGGHRLRRFASSKWSIERQVRFAAGLIVATAVLASLFVPAAKWLAFGVGFGLVFAALTNTCAMGALLLRLPYNRGSGSCDVESMVARLRQGAVAAHDGVAHDGMAHDGMAHDGMDGR